MAYDEYAQEHMLDDSKLFRKARLGVQAENFLNSDVGKKVIERAEAEIEVGYKKLSVADADNPSAIRTIQFDIAVARAVPTWLGQIIRDGLAAEEVLQTRDEDEGTYTGGGSY